MKLHEHEWWPGLPLILAPALLILDTLWWTGVWWLGGFFAQLITMMLVFWIGYEWGRRGK
jgi:hypothetical protein